MRCERLGSLVLVLGLTLSGCGSSGGDDGFTDSDWDAFFEWCVEHKAGPNTDCGGVANAVQDRVNLLGRDEECFVRLTKRVVSMTGEAIAIHEDDLKDDFDSCKSSV